MELFPLRYLIFKWRVFGAGLQLQLGGFGGMDYSLRTTNPAPRSTNLGITKLGLSLPEFPRFLRPTIPASYVLWGKFSINRSCQTIAGTSVFNVLYRLVIFTIFLPLWNETSILFAVLRQICFLFFLSSSLSLDMDFLIHGYSLYSTDLEKLVNPPVDGVAWNLYDARYRESWGCVRVLDGWFCEIFFHPGVRKLLYCSEYTCNASSRNHSMEVCCSTGNYYIGRWNFTKLCFDPRNAGFLRSKNFFFSPFFFSFLFRRNTSDRLINFEAEQVVTFEYIFCQMWLSEFVYCKRT